MAKMDYELKLKVLMNKLASINIVIEAMKSQYQNATNNDDRDIFKRMAIMQEESYESAKLELVTFIIENNQN